jgi:hypothetical protein
MITTSLSAASSQRDCRITVGVFAWPDGARDELAGAVIGVLGGLVLTVRWLGPGALRGWPGGAGGGRSP